MKRILALSFALILLAVMCVTPVSAEETINLVPADGEWVGNDNGGTSCTVQFADGVATFSGSVVGTWPDIRCHYANDYIVNINDYSLVYDFTVENGATNISFFFTQEDYTFPLANSALQGDFDYDTGSGDLMTGTYSGTVKLSDFVNSTALLGNTPFDTSLISPGDTITFCGIQVYSTNGGVITVNKLELVPNSAASDPAESEEPSEEVSEDVSSAESSEAESTEESSEDVSVEESSEAESKEESKEESKTESKEASNAVSKNDASSSDSDENSSATIWIIIGIVAAVVIVVIIVVVSKKKK